MTKHRMCQSCGFVGHDVVVMDDPFTKALYPEGDAHDQMALCPSCEVDRFEEE